MRRLYGAGPLHLFSPTIVYDHFGEILGALNIFSLAFCLMLYLKGRFYFDKRTKEDVLRSIESYQQAISLDPNFALAHVGIADSYGIMSAYGYAAPNDVFPQAKAAARRALQP